MGNLTRGEAAVLLFRAVAPEEYKVTYDDEKVTYGGGGQNPANTEYTVPQVTAEIADGKIIVHWQVITNPKLQGYKVVLSRYDSTPQYPENGYFEWITDRDRDYTVVQAGDSYNGGDFGGRFESGKTYYYYVTATDKFGNVSLPSEVVDETVP
jgi:hypothetical protein